MYSKSKKRSKRKNEMNSISEFVNLIREASKCTKNVPPSNTDPDYKNYNQNPLYFVPFEKQGIWFKCLYVLHLCHYDDLAFETDKRQQEMYKAKFSKIYEMYNSKCPDKNRNYTNY